MPCHRYKKYIIEILGIKKRFKEKKKARRRGANNNNNNKNSVNFERKGENMIHVSGARFKSE